MLYTEFINKAFDETIVQADNGLFYLEPLWRSILHDNQMFFNDISDFEVDPAEVEDVLKLEVERRNTIISNKPAVIDWVYNIITTQIDPTILDEQNNYFKNLTEYLKANKEAQALKDKEDWDKFKKID